MREIKFRVWDKGSKCWIRGNKQDSELDVYNIARYLYRETSTFPQYESHKKRIDVDIMQSTGLKDMNGKEIYEGDIIKTSNLGSSYYQVVYDLVGACWSGKRAVQSTPDFRTREDGCIWTAFPWHNSTKMMEVLGNIHQHPALLNEVEDKEKSTPPSN